MVTCLRAVLRRGPATLPDAELFSGQAVCTFTAGPTAANSCGTRLADSAVSMSSFPSCRTEVGFRLGYFARETRLLRFACQADPVKAALSLPVFDWKIFFYVPLLADIALPRRASSCIVLCTFSAYPVFVISFPLSCCEGATLFSLIAGGAWPFFTVFC